MIFFSSVRSRRSPICLLSVFDPWVIDGTVNGVAATARGFSTVWRGLQTGNVQHYVVGFLAGDAGAVGLLSRTAVTMSATRLRRFEPAARYPGDRRGLAVDSCRAGTRTALFSLALLRQRRRLFSGRSRSSIFSTAATARCSWSNGCRGCPAFGIEYIVGIDGISLFLGFAHDLAHAAGDSGFLVGQGQGQRIS